MNTYEVLQQAGLNPPQEFKNPVICGKVFKFLEKNGWKVYRRSLVNKILGKGLFVEVHDDNPCFLVGAEKNGEENTWMNYYANYDERKNLLYKPEDIGAVIVKE